MNGRPAFLTRPSRKPAPPAAATAGMVGVAAPALLRAAADRPAAPAASAVPAVLLLGVDAGRARLQAGDPGGPNVACRAVKA